MKVKQIDWQENGFGHTPVGLMFRVQEQGDGAWLLERFEGSSTTKSLHDSEAFAKGLAFAKYDEQVRSCLTHWEMI